MENACLDQEVWPCHSWWTVDGVSVHRRCVVSMLPVEESVLRAPQTVRGPLHAPPVARARTLGAVGLFALLSALMVPMHPRGVRRVTGGLPGLQPPALPRDSHCPGELVPCPRFHGFHLPPGSARAQTPVQLLWSRFHFAIGQNSLP